MQDIIPPYLLTKARADEFLLWLRDTHLDPEDKRQLLMLWADRVGLKITDWDYYMAGLK